MQRRSLERNNARAEVTKSKVSTFMRYWRVRLTRLRMLAAQSGVNRWTWRVFQDSWAYVCRRVRSRPMTRCCGRRAERGGEQKLAKAIRRLRAHKSLRWMACQSWAYMHCGEGSFTAQHAALCLGVANILLVRVYCLDGWAFPGHRMREYTGVDG